MDANTVIGPMFIIVVIAVLLSVAIVRQISLWGAWPTLKRAVFGRNVTRNSISYGKRASCPDHMPTCGYPKNSEYRSKIVTLAGYRNRNLKSQFKK